MNKQEQLQLRTDFWNYFISESKKVNSGFAKAKVHFKKKEASYAIKANFNISIELTPHNTRCELYIRKHDDLEYNQQAYIYLKELEQEIEQNFKRTLEWIIADDCSNASIRYSMDLMNIYEKDKWGEITSTLLELTQHLDDATRAHVLAFEMPDLGDDE